MVANIIIVLIFLFVCYAYTNHNREFNATASAIQQIWSGSCRLSCRSSRYSGFSGLSGLAPVDLSGHLGSCDCVCDSCPCALVENVLKRCRPATNVYSKLIEIISDCYYDVVKTLTDLYNYLAQVLRNESYGQRQAQLISINELSSGANLNFVNKLKDELEKGKNKMAANLRSRSITFRRESDFDEFSGSSKTTPSLALNLGVSEPVVPKTSPSLAMNKEAVEPARKSEEPLRILSNCSRCVEKNMTCIGTCPRAKKK